MTTEQSGRYRLSAPLHFDFDAAANKANPFPLFASMRAAGPIIPVKLPFVGKGWVTTTYDATLAMLKDNTAFVQEARHAGRSGIAGMKWWMPRSLKLLTNNMLLKDEPDHRRLRKLVDQAFRRRHVRDMRSNIEQIADRLLDDFEGMDEADLANAYARLLPLEVICELLGLPRQDREVFSTWAKTATSMRNSFGILRAFFSMSGVINYVRDQIEDCRREPREGVISDLVRAEEDGDKLSEDELVSMVFLLLFAGFETTTHLISDSIIALEQYPEQKAYLLADPAWRMERAVEELGRYTTPVQSTKPRYIAKDCEFFGQKLERGDLVMGLLAAANSDPAVFDVPDKLMLDRFPNPHLVFGTGIHFCLGMQLARVEAQSALARLYARYPDLALASPDNIQWIERYGLRGVKALPVRLNAMRVRQAA